MADLTEDLVALAPALRADLTEARYRVEQIADLLGDSAHTALDRGEPVPARRAVVGAGPLGALIALFLIADPCPEDQVARALPRTGVERAVAAGLLTRSGEDVQAALDLRPVLLGTGEHWVLADLDDARGRPSGPDHVIGVGQATVSLLHATPTDPVATVLDLGTGGGIQAFQATDYARTVTATDVNPRAAVLARAGAVLNDREIEVLTGSWFEPVAGRRFDRVVANPPFVVGPGGVGHTYRDSGLDLDGASQLVVSAAPEHLNPGGIATLLAAWVHRPGEHWRDRVASWLPDHGVEAWIVQRDVAEPELYVGTWLRDGGVDPRSADGAAQAGAWLDALAAAEVEGVGFGVVYLRAIDGPTTVTAEDLTQPYDDPLGAEATAHFARSDWLAAHSVAEATVRLADSVVLERVLQPRGAADPDPQTPVFQQTVARLHRADGPRWVHEVDEDTVAVLSGLARGDATVATVAALLATARGRDQEETLTAVTGVITDLIRHGLVVPMTAG